MENYCPGSILPIPSIVNEMYMYDQMYGYADKFFLNKNVVTTQGYNTQYNLLSITKNCCQCFDLRGRTKWGIVINSFKSF